MPDTTNGATGATLAALQKQYFFLDRNFSKLFAACATDAQRDALRVDYVQARDNFLKARTEAFAEDDPMVADLRGQIGDAQSQIEKSAKKLADVSKTLDLITKAVNLGSRLVTLGAV